MITITEKKMTRGGIWEAFFNGNYLTCRAYITEEEKYDMLKECIEKAKNQIPLTIEFSPN